MGSSGLRSLFIGDERLRAGWRIVVFAALFLAFLVVGQTAASMLPPARLPWAGVIVMTAAALAAGWIVLARLDGRSPGALGFTLERAALRDTGIGLLVGMGLITLAAVLLLATGAAGFVEDSGSVAGYAASMVGTFAFFAVAAASEEALFRGYAFQALVEGIGAWPAVLLSSALFSLGHAANPNVDAVALANIFLAGVLLALAYLRTRSLWFATAVHLGWNWMMATVLDFPVSGLVFDTPLYNATVRGAEWWTGGEFGPEAGLAGTLALGAGIVWTLRSGWIGESPRMQELRPIVDRRLGAGRSLS